MGRWLVAALLCTGCFSGEGTLGAVCGGDGDCGDDQACTNSICGRCGDGVADPGEVCFGEAEPIDIGIDVQALRVINLDGDRVADVVVADADNVVPLTAGLTPGVPVPAPGVIALRGGDVDGDMLTDAVALADGFTVLFGDGTGALAAGPSVDGAVVDVVVDPGRGVVAASGSTVTLHAVQSDRTLVASEPIEAGGPVIDVAGPAPIDGDAILDLVAVLDTGAIAVLTGTGDGYVPATQAGFGEPVRVVGLVDFEADGLADLVGLTTTDQIVVLHGDGQGSLTRGASVDADPGANTLGFGDLNLDFELDVLTAVGGLHLHTVRGRALQPSTALPAPGDWTTIGVGPFDADFSTDILLHGPTGLALLRGTP